MSPPWFRGEPEDISSPLLPKLYRTYTVQGKEHDEKALLQHFRMKAPSLGLPYIPHRENTDQWLFLAQHVRLPTRLLDWTEGLLIALFFALQSEELGAVIWMLNPDELNRKTYGDFKKGDFSLSWFSQKSRPLIGEDLIHIKNIVKKKGEYPLVEILPYNIGSMNIHSAWTGDKAETPYPWALHPTNVHPRMSSQISRFTIHGMKKMSMHDMDLGELILRKYTISSDAIPSMKDELRMMGITRSSLFPELDGLSDELAEIY